MASIYKYGNVFRYQGKDGKNYVKKSFKTFEEALAFANDNPNFGVVKRRGLAEFLYLRTKQNGCRKWEVRFPSALEKGKYTAIFSEKQEAAAFRDMYIKKWQTDPDFLKEDLRNCFLSFKYKINPVVEDKSDEIKALKMQISILTDVLKEIEGDN